MGLGRCWNYRLQLIAIMLSVMLIMLAGYREINASEATGENKGVGEFDIQKKTIVLNSGYEMPIQAGFIAIPGSSNPDHIAENYDIFDFELTSEDMERINRLDRHERYESW